MRYVLLVISLFMQISLYAQVKRTYKKEYVLLKVVRKKMTFNEKTKLYNITEANQKDIDKLNEPLRALAAYYSGLAQSNCDYDSNDHVLCTLTTALGLGRQGSEKQISLISKWMANDTVAQAIINDSCFVGMPGSSHFTDYDFLNFTVNQDTVVISYGRLFYDHGATSRDRRKDIALIKNNAIVFIKR